MKIIYLISSINKANGGTGGHYYSLISLATAMESVFDVMIVNIGTQKSIALENSELKIYNLLDQNLNSIRLIKRLKQCLIQEGKFVLHAFDYLSYFYARIVSRLLKIPVILTKCGGQNPKLYYPYCKYLVTFSRENFSYFKIKNKFHQSNVYLIPNRVVPFDYDEKKAEELKSKYTLSHYKCVFLRITRINEAYKGSIIQLINLATECNKRGIHSCVLVIGTVENQSISDYLKTYSAIPIFFESNSYFNENAKRLLGLADVVLGTGRGFMEAALKGKIMFAPLSDSPLPVLINQDTFELLFGTNFSERGALKYFDTNSTINELCNLLIDNTKHKRYLEEMKSLYVDNFSVLSKIETYKDIYMSMRYDSKLHFSDVVLNYGYLLRTYYASRRSIANSKKELHLFL